jgi:hypothetical protein
MSAGTTERNLGAMPAGDVSFRTYDPGVYQGMLETTSAIALGSNPETPPTLEDYRLHARVPVRLAEGTGVIDAKLLLTPEEFSTFLNPSLVNSPAESTELPEPDDPLSIFDELSDEEGEDDEAPTRNKNQERHEARMAVVGAALARLVDEATVDTLLTSYGQKPASQHSGVALNAHDLPYWLTAAPKPGKNWAFFRPHTGGSTHHSGGTTHYTAGHTSLATGENYTSADSGFRDILLQDLTLVADAIRKVVGGYDAAIADKGYLFPDYTTVPMLGVTASKDYFTGYTDRDAPAGQTLLSSRYDQAVYGLLGGGYLSGTVQVQTVHKTRKKSQPLVESVYVPFGGVENTFLRYTASTSGEPSHTGYRRHTYGGMYGSDRKPEGFAPQQFYATVAFLRGLGKAAAANG